MNCQFIIMFLLKIKMKIDKSLFLSVAAVVRMVLARTGS